LIIHDVLEIERIFIHYFAMNHGDLAQAETFDSLRNRIRGRFDTLSPHLQRIARTALDQPNGFALNTIAVIASEIDVQPSTLIRFAKEFGYSGFSGMQQVFRHRLIEGAPVYREQVYEEQSTAGQSGSLANILKECIDEQIDSLRKVRQEIDPRALSRALSILRDADHIYVAGLRRSRPIATYLAYGLVRSEHKCTLLDFGGGMAEQQIANMDSRDLLVGIAFTPYSPPVVDVVRDAHLRGRSVITLTDTPSSPLAHNSTETFFVDNGTHGQFRPIAGAIGLVQSLIVSLLTNT
jgi:DNA-binding MurR/RpiR family transcriptional regulator